MTIVEFSDFQCSFCRKFWRETLPRLDERYIRTGRVRFVYRHLAILGELSVEAANAAECAGEQGKFWSCHGRLFERAGPLTFTQARQKGYAGEIGLDGKTFGACVEQGRHREHIRQETIIGRMLGMSETFVEVIEETLAEAGRSRQGSPKR